jgi:glycosyltransferase involved in cell wall biosynthesis
MQKPNVLFISSWYPSKEHPTLGNFVQRHAESINPFVNLYVIYVTSSNRIKSEFEIENEIINGVNTTVVYYKKVNSKLPLFNSITKLNRYRMGYKKGIEFIESQFNVSNIELTHCNVTFPAGLIAYELKKKRNIPYVLTEHWTLFLPYKKDFSKLPFYIQRKMKMIAKEASRIMPVSEHLANSMKNKGLLGDYTIIPNVAETDLFGLKYSNNGGVKQILHVSTLIDDHKNITGIFEALKTVSEKRQDFKLVIISDGDIELAKKHQQEVGLGNQFVEYHSTKTPQEIAEFYRFSDFFVLFSNYENLPVVMVESFSCGIPFVSSNVGGISEYVTEENGLLVEPRNEKQLAEALVKMLTNIKDYNSEKIREMAVLNFDNKIVGKKYYDLYKEIIK